MLTLQTAVLQLHLVKIQIHQQELLFGKMKTGKLINNGIRGVGECIPPLEAQLFLFHRSGRLRVISFSAYLN